MEEGEITEIGPQAKVSDAASGVGVGVSSSSYAVAGPSTTWKAAKAGRSIKWPEIPAFSPVPLVQNEDSVEQFLESILSQGSSLTRKRGPVFGTPSVPNERPSAKSVAKQIAVQTGAVLDSHQQPPSQAGKPEILFNSIPTRKTVIGTPWCYTGYRSTNHALGAHWDEESDGEEESTSSKSLLKVQDDAPSAVVTTNLDLPAPQSGPQRLGQIAASDSVFDTYMTDAAMIFKAHDASIDSHKHQSRAPMLIGNDGSQADPARRETQISFHRNGSDFKSFCMPLKSLTTTVIHPERAAMLENLDGVDYDPIPELVPETYSKTGSNNVPVGARPLDENIPPPVQSGMLRNGKARILVEHGKPFTGKAISQKKRQNERTQICKPSEYAQINQFITSLKTGTWIPGLQNPEEVLKVAMQIQQSLGQDGVPRLERATKLRKAIRETAKFDFQSDNPLPPNTHKRSSSLVLDDKAVSHIKKLISSTISEMPAASSSNAGTSSQTDFSTIVSPMLGNGAGPVQAIARLQPNSSTPSGPSVRNTVYMPGGAGFQPCASSSGEAAFVGVDTRSGSSLFPAPMASNQPQPAAPFLQPKLPISSIANVPRQRSEATFTEANSNASPYKVVPLPEYVSKGDFAVLCDLLCVSATFQFGQSSNNSALLRGVVRLQPTAFNKDKIWEVRIDDADNSRTFEQASEALKRKAFDVVAFVSLFNDRNQVDRCIKHGVRNYIMDLYYYLDTRGLHCPVFAHFEPRAPPNLIGIPMSSCEVRLAQGKIFGDRKKGFFSEWEARMDAASAALKWIAETHWQRDCHTA